MALSPLKQANSLLLFLLFFSSYIYRKKQFHSLCDQFDCFAQEPCSYSSVFQLQEVSGISCAWRITIDSSITSVFFLLWSYKHDIFCILNICHQKVIFTSDMTTYLLQLVCLRDSILAVINNFQVGKPWYSRIQSLRESFWAGRCLQLVFPIIGC